MQSKRENSGRGWYLYGITKVSAQEKAELPDIASNESESEPGVDRVIHDLEPIQRLRFGDLVAVVKRASLDDYSTEALQRRVRDTAWLTTNVQNHNQVIAAIHHQQAILPAKFGSVYAHADDIALALENDRDALLKQLDLLEGCDEWAIHIYADIPMIQQRAKAEVPVIQEMQKELDTATPGRSFFIQRKLAGELTAVTDQMLAGLAQAIWEHLQTVSVAGQLSDPVRNDKNEVEIMRAAFLVQRGNDEALLEAVDSFTSAEHGLRWEYSGPWPPYSFALGTREQSQ